MCVLPDIPIGTEWVQCDKCGYSYKREILNVMEYDHDRDFND